MEYYSSKFIILQIPASLVESNGETYMYNL